MDQQGKLPEFQNPPVIEVVCGIQFESLKALLAPHLGLLWEEFRGDYPTCEEVPPLAPAIEQFGDQGPISIEFTDRPPLPRVWFTHMKGTGIIQVQRDRFLHNWKRFRKDDEYPRYRSVIDMFKDRLAKFEAFVSKHDLGSLSALQYELTYVNHIRPHNGLLSLGDLGEILPDLSWGKDVGRFLSAPESFFGRFTFPFPDQTGRMHVTAKNAVHRESGELMLVLELTARGMPVERSRDAMWGWFDLAHEWIVRGFADVTSERMHRKYWGRTS